MEAAPREGEETCWVTFDVDEEEALSLSDLPILDRSEEGGDGGPGLGGEEPTMTDECTRQEAAEDFEFRTCGGGGMRLEAAGGDDDMCAADEVFFQGQILPLRPSVSSDGGLFPASRCGSRSESMDRYSSAAGSCPGFESSRSLSGRSSTSISRSHSTHSSNSVSSGGRLSVSNNFYAHPSPKPHMCPRRWRQSTSSARNSTSSAWGLLRLGLVKTPEIDLDGLKLRKTSAGLITARTVTDHRRRVGANEDGGRPPERKAAPLPCNARHRTDGGVKFDDARSKSSGRDEGKLPEKKASRSTLGSRLRCGCSPGDAVQATCSRAAVPGDVPARERAQRGGSSSSRRRREGWCHSRTFQWLAELPVPKGDGGALSR